AGKAVLGRGNKSGAKAEDETAAAATSDQGQQAAGQQAQNHPVVSANGTIGGANTPATPMSGMGGMGGAHAQQEEDQEHNRASFLIEADPDEAFGANVATAPPVIGAWSDEDED
ncbi:hypothetical protein FNH05_37430, partial [Amycolatopsis rhizosphaerae]